MSAGAFEISRYAASYNGGTEVHPIKIQPETLLAEINGVPNDAPTGAITNPISASVSKGKREYGLSARFVTLRAPATGQPTGYEPRGITKIPALTTAFFDEANRGVTCTYLGASFTVVSSTAENVV